MTDYGHELRFGTFITPGNNPADRPVQLAQVSEQLGFDLVTFQDHPYQPAFLDTWSLMSWVLASTARIHVSANVLNLPLRQPAVMARAAASLDLLSGGRFDLALGAGGFWDAIAAMGGPRRTPGEGVQALEEAIDVIRGIWDVEDRSPLRVPGEFYHLDGAKRGPAPAHDIPIWIGALKPRMLRLTGRKGDGWLPSLAYLKPGDLERGNAIIDEAAIGVGRDPREVRRMLNVGGRFERERTDRLSGPPSAWVQDLLDLAIGNGVSTFILAGDDPSTMQTFITDVVPALREAVAEARAASGTSESRVRNAVALAKRREGIDYDAIPAALEAIAVEPGDARYSRLRNTYMRGGAPGLVLLPRSVEEVVASVAVARANPGVALGIRSGGHGISGRSTNDGGIVIDLRELDEIEVIDQERRLVRIGPGARWTDVAAALGEQGWALTSGDYGGVGVGGLATAGGIGLLARSQGLTIDHLRAVELVTADGSIVRADADQHPELLWAARGAGGNIGIVTAFEFEVDPVSDVAWAQLAFDASDTAEFLERWASAVEAAPRELTSFLLMGATTPSRPSYARVYSVVASDDPDTILGILQPLADAAPLVDQSVVITSYAAVMANASDAEHAGAGDPHMRSALVEHVTPEIAAAIAGLLASGATNFFQIRSLGGAVADLAPDATAFADRTANFSFAAVGPDGDALDRWWAPIRELSSGLYLSFETDLDPMRVSEAFPPTTLERLRQIKAEVDPDNLFRDNFNISAGDTTSR